MVTDLANFTALSHRDEALSLRLLMEHRAIVRPVLARYSGREIKTMGDGFLVSFDSALNAVECAFEIQRRCTEWVEESPEDRPRTRIALHLGDVVDDRGDILGDVVNVASRLESLAEAGGILVSGPVYEQVRGHLPVRFEKMPTPRLKGVDTPIDAYRALPAEGESSSEPRPAPPGRIAVLPFASISPDPRDEYLADGLTEELIGVLSRLGGLRVIARTSVEVYKSRPKPVPQIGTELNVRTLLEGSIRRSGQKVRVTAQLIDVPTQEPLWSQSFDRELDDVFAIQSEIAQQVAETLQVKVLEQEQRRIRAKPTGITESYLAYLRGRTLLHSLNPERLKEAEAQFVESARLDPANARAYSGLADARLRIATMFATDRPLEEMVEALRACRELATRALLLDPAAAEAYATLGRLQQLLYEFKEAEKALRTSITLNPSYAQAHRWYAMLLTERGQLPEALAELRIAEQADPLSPSVEFALAPVLFALGRDREAAIALRRLAELEPDGVRYHVAAFEGRLWSRDSHGLLEEVRWLCAHGSSHGHTDLEPYWFGRYYGALRDTARAHAEIEKMRAVRDPTTGKPSAWAASQIATVYAQIDEVDECLSWVEQAYTAKTLVFTDCWVSASFESVRRDPRFREFLSRVGLA